MRVDRESGTAAEALACDPPTGGSSVCDTGPIVSRENHLCGLLSDVDTLLLSQAGRKGLCEIW